MSKRLPTVCWMGDLAVAIDDLQTRVKSIEASMADAALAAEGRPRCSKCGKSIPLYSGGAYAEVPGGPFFPACTGCLMAQRQKRADEQQAAARKERERIGKRVLAQVEAAGCEGCLVRVVDQPTTYDQGQPYLRDHPESTYAGQVGKVRESDGLYVEMTFSDGVSISMWPHNVRVLLEQGVDEEAT